MKSILNITLLTMLLAGCDSAPPSIEFQLSSSRPEYELSYIPIVEYQGNVRPAEAFQKTVDMAGYHENDIGLEYPENLATPWMLGSLDQFDRVGIVIFERTTDEQLELNTAKVFWFDDQFQSSAGDRYPVVVPDLETLPSFDATTLKH